MKQDWKWVELTPNRFQLIFGSFWTSQSSGSLSSFNHIFVFSSFDNFIVHDRPVLALVCVHSSGSQEIFISTRLSSSTSACILGSFQILNYLNVQCSILYATCLKKKFHLSESCSACLTYVQVQARNCFLLKTQAHVQAHIHAHVR